MRAFEGVKDILLDLQTADLMLVNPALDKNKNLVEVLGRFESTFKKAKKLYLEPDNLI